MLEPLAVKLHATFATTYALTAGAVLYALSDNPAAGVCMGILMLTVYAASLSIQVWAQR